MSSRPPEISTRIKFLTGRASLSRVSIKEAKNGDVVITASLRPDHGAEVKRRMVEADPQTPEKVSQVFALWVVEHMTGRSVQALVRQAVGTGPTMEEAAREHAPGPDGTPGWRPHVAGLS